MASQFVQSVAASQATDWANAHQGPELDEEYWYAVLVGRSPGVFFKGCDIAANVSRIPGAMVVKCYTEEEARVEFANSVEDGIAQKVNLVERSRYLYMSALDSLPMGEIPDFKPPSRRWYSVTVGRFPGVYNGPSGLAANTSGVSGAESTKFMTRSEAVAHFVSALESGLVIQCIYDIERVPVVHVV